jgi:galactose mutarotase-like enzyme
MPLFQQPGPDDWLFVRPGDSAEDPNADRLRLAPGRGGLLRGWRCNGQELLYMDEARFNDPTLSVRGGMPVLFPICGGLSGNSLDLGDGRQARLSQHGFARDQPWTIRESADGSGVVLELSDTPATLEAWPYAFALALELSPETDALAMALVVSNRSPWPMPFSLGLHPYFAVSDLAGVRLEGLPPRCLDQAAMAQAATAERLAALPAGVDLLLEPAGPVRLLDPAGRRAIVMEPQAPLDLAVIWSDPPRPMVCLEPWSAPRGALVSGDRRLMLAPGEQRRLACRYRLETL